MKLSFAFLGAVLCASTALAGRPSHKHKILDRVQKARANVEKRMANQQFQHPEIRKRATQFLTDKTKPFAVNGSGLPEVPFDVGESYAGLLPISDSPDETRKLFFWFFPTTNVAPKDEIVIWLNGGPGCSSLGGLLQENGPFTWMPGTSAPVPNPYSWTNLTNVIWVEQPVGVGFSQGMPNITNEIQLSAEFRGFWKSFINTFELYDWTTYLTGESYAGMYVPYIADSFIQADDPKYFKVGGISINDPLIGDETVQQEVTAAPFVEYWNNLLYLNDSFMERARQRDDECNYTTYRETYFKFPPVPGPIPLLPDPFATPAATCDQLDNYYGAILELNPCFNIYHITDTCPYVSNEVGSVATGGYLASRQEIYFNRTDVQAALHAVVGTNWAQCADGVFSFGNATSNLTDTSPGPANDGVLQRVIEATNNTIIGSGDFDMLLNTNGTLFAIQNMTWHGLQGLQAYPNTPLYVPYHPEYLAGAMAGAGYMGVWTQERGMTFYTSHLAGHELPGYTAGVGYRMLEILLGRIQDFSSLDDFTTQTGNFTGTTDLYKRGVMT